jgi:hypothetical protein
MLTDKEKLSRAVLTLKVVRDEVERAAQGQRRDFIDLGRSIRWALEAITSDETAARLPDDEELAGKLDGLASQDTPRFALQPHQRWDKELEISGPDEFQLRITVDYDDVATEVVDDAVQKMLGILNKHWNPDWKPVEPVEE